MALIDDVKTICNRLASKGWGDLLKKHGLDITKADLAAELARDLPNIDRNVPGFEDFAAEGHRGIEPGVPARSLLFHAFASMNVLELDGNPLGDFPTRRELEIVENYVFAAWKPSLTELTGIAAGRLLAVVVYATEYRPGIDTVHRRHADMCFSRTGVARVGTKKPRYDAPSRGSQPTDPNDAHAFCVLPARYSAWIAVQAKGDPTTFGPMRVRPDDAARDFWVPLHKLFSGAECLQGLNLSVALSAHHVNEKLRRVHLEFLRRGADGGWHAPEIDQPPFRFTDRIAELSTEAEDGEGLLIPVPNPLVEKAVFRGEALTYRVPTAQEIASRTEFLPTIEITANGPRRAPEYLHARTEVGGTTSDLNDIADPAGKVGQGHYRAQHYIDFSGDGWIEAECPELRPQMPRFIAAYSVVAAPDFFFAADQREIMDWFENRAPANLRSFLWETPPEALSDSRFPPNLRLNNTDFHAGDPTIPIANFRPEDATVSAIVSMPIKLPARERPLIEARRLRHSVLPDGAAGVFAPGWDTSFGTTNNVQHLAAYGLGSPFPEDAKLCAALSTFWPAAAPDAGRSFSKSFPTVSPLTDEEIGSVGNLPWDGVRGPRVVKNAAGDDVVEYPSFDHVDYVLNAAANKFTLALTSKIATREYVARVLAMARAYRSVGVTAPNGKDKWNVLSFRRVASTDAELANAQNLAGKTLGGDIFRIELFKPKEIAQQPTDFKLRHVGITDRNTVFVGGNAFVLKKDGANWRAVNV